MPSFVLPLADPDATLGLVGGKGMSLAKMARTGLPVPDGFYVTTEAYRCFLDENQIWPAILDALGSMGPAESGNMTALEEISQRIRILFRDGITPVRITAQVTEAYARLCGHAAAEQHAQSVAVRSSATVEDLPGASFAGQLETYLNIRGVEAVLTAVKQCWASLWTARAIAYRARQGMDPSSVAMGVVVQKMVCADAAGIMFTANPVNGKRDELVINAAWGLGEAVVSGRISPDMLTIEKTTGKVLYRETAEKRVMIVQTETGAEVRGNAPVSKGSDEGPRTSDTGSVGGIREIPVPNAQKKKAVLSDAQASELAGLGVMIETLYGRPMDIEWALAGERFAILQARPITALQEVLLPEPPLEWKSPYPKPLLAHVDSTDLAPDVVSPLFATLGIPMINTVYLKMYERVMGLRGEDVPIFITINGYIYLCFAKGWKFWKYMLAHASTVKKLYAYGKERADELRTTSPVLVNQWGQVAPDSLKAAELLAGVRELFEASAGHFNAAICRPIPRSNFSELFFSWFYNALIKRKNDPTAVAFLLGLENMPLRAEKSLFDLAQWAKAQPELAEDLARTPADEVWAALQSDPVPAPLAGAFAARFAAHLEAFGHILYDLDFMHPVPADDPVPLLNALKVYLAGKGNHPYLRQQEQERQRQQVELAISRRTIPLGRKWFQKLLASAQACAIEREDAIANIGLPYPQLRRLLRELAQRLVKDGAIAQPDDIYWLEAQEVDALAAALDKNEPLTSHAAGVENRRATLKRARTAVPPTVMPESAFLAKMMAPRKSSRRNLLTGYGASAGTTTAPACILRGPEDFGQMRPGDVIVAVITTPAWTPLFALASAVVTDIGGPLSHGSIVAREYGIPAVVATGDATRRICTGQVITVDGEHGTVEVLSR